MALYILILLSSVSMVLGQRPFYAGSRPIGYPELPTTTEGLGNKFGENGTTITTTTQRLPLEANGDRELVDRLSKLPIDKQPFWFINWQAYEANRNKPQTYPLQPNQFAQPLAPVTNQQLPLQNIPSTTEIVNIENRIPISEELTNKTTELQEYISNSEYSNFGDVELNLSETEDPSYAGETDNKEDSSSETNNETSEFISNFIGPSDGIDSFPEKPLTIDHSDIDETTSPTVTTPKPSIIEYIAILSWAKSNEIVIPNDLPFSSSDPNTLTVYNYLKQQRLSSVSSDSIVDYEWYWLS